MSEEPFESGQRLVDEYHRAVSTNHSMHVVHRDWHANNPDPRDQLPTRRDSEWGMDIEFGQRFLQMHHEMLNAADDEPREWMNHVSLRSWFSSQRHDWPVKWDPRTPIPDILSYTPDASTYPDEIRRPIEAEARNRRISVEALLRRNTNNPRFDLPSWFSNEGVSAGQPGEPYTGARRLADFKNLNQLGSCLVWPHNAWHGRIGGAMGSTWTAIADPIFYFGVHWHVDEVFLAYLDIQQQREDASIPGADSHVSHALPTAELPTGAALTPRESEQRLNDIVISTALSTPFETELPQR